MKRTLQLIITLGCCFLFSNVLAVKKVTLDSLRFKESDSTLQVLMEFSDPVEYHSFQLHDPERYVVDLSGVSLRVGLPSESLPWPLKNLRAHGDAEKLRLVFDLDQNLQPRLVPIAKSKVQVAGLSIDIPRTGMKASSVPVKKTKLPTVSSKSKPKSSSATVAQSSSSRQQLPNPATVKPRPTRDVIVVIDPGHGGKDPGAQGSNGTREKDVVLSIAKRLQAQINKQPGFKAVLTRKGDYYIGLRDRLAIARQHQGDMFIAIHADAHEHLDARGVGVYALSQRGATSEATRWLAQRENQSELVGGLDLTDKDHVLRSVLIDLSQTQSITASLHMGSVLLEHLGKFAPLHHSNVEQAAFVVLKSPDIPSLLIETGFISNTLEERRLRNPIYQDKIAGALLVGIKDYFLRHPPRGSTLALMTRNRGQV